MQQVNINSRNGNKCAFCKHWYDLLNQYIQPKAPGIGLWEYDEQAKCKCLLKNVEQKSFHSCNKFEKKCKWQRSGVIFNREFIKSIGEGNEKWIGIN